MTMRMKTVPKIQLHDGNQIPQLGLGVWQVSNEQVVSTIREALAAGYRAIDTAAAYDNEEGVGKALRSAGVPREQIYITTKLWNDSHGFENAFRAMRESLRRLQLDYVDLYLIHWPVPRANAFVETWRALAKIREEGLAKSIGVSNFTIAHLEQLLAETGIVPAVNQIELHPRLQQKALREFHSKHGIVTESWSPLAQGQLLEDKTIFELARKYRRSPAQIILRWHIQNNLVVIPKSVTPGRILENIDLFDLSLHAEDMNKIAALNTNQRVGPDPDTFALDAVGPG